MFVQHTLLESAAILAVVALAFFAVLVLYRLTLHPLARARIPGPKLAAATYWYSFYQDVIAGPCPGQEVFHFARLHDRYGSVIRISPDEVHVRDPEWFDMLYANGRRDKWLRNHKANGSPGSIAQTGPGEHHRARRAPLTPFFSRRAVARLEHSIVTKVDQLTSKIEADYVGRELEIGVSFGALTLDIITEYCFGQSWRCLLAPDFAPGWKTTMTKLFEPVPFVKQFPWLLQFMNSLPRWATAALAPDVTRLLDAKREVLLQVKRIIAEREEGKLPIDSNDDPRAATVFETILDSSLPAHEKSAPRLTDEGFVMVVAGGETTAKTLSNAVFYLLDDPEWLGNLTRELDEAMPNLAQLPSWSKLEQLPCLSAVIKETLRLSNLVTNRLQLIDTNDLICGGTRIPGGSPVSMTVMDIHFDADIFPEPLKFMPKRWVGAKGNELSRFYAPFLKGTRSCLGQNLAYAEIYLGLAAMIRRFDMQLASNSSREQVDTMRDCFIGMPSPGARPVMVKILGKRK